MSRTEEHTIESVQANPAPTAAGRPQGSPPILAPGEVLGGCVIERFIARGGMGELYQARKVNLGCDVAMKVLLPSLVAEESILSRFEREAKVAASLCHPSIVRVYDVGDERGLYYIVMEFVQGRDLRSIIQKEGPLPLTNALRITRQIADALDYAHRRGVIHRDVKPANIMLSAEGIAKLTDLGLARPAREDSEVTMAGEILGTPGFMSPEQFRGDPIDGRSDLYSLGATLYVLLTGSPPFRADTTATLLHKVLNDRPPALKALAPGVPDRVVGMVQRLMAKHAGARFQTGKEIVAEINEVLVGRFVVAREGPKRAEPRPPVEEPTSWRWIVPAMGAVLVAVAIWLVVPSFEVSSKPAHSATRAEPQREAPAGSVILRSGPAKPPDSEPGATEQAKRPEPKGPIVPAELKDRLAVFRDAIKSRSAEEILECFRPSHRTDPILQSSLGKFLGDVERVGLNPGFVVPNMAGDSEATATFQLTNQETGQSFGFPTDWVLVEGHWYVKPRRYEFQAGAPTPGK